MYKRVKKSKRMILRIWTTRGVTTDWNLNKYDWTIQNGFLRIRSINRKARFPDYADIWYPLTSIEHLEIDKERE